MNISVEVSPEYTQSAILIPEINDAKEEAHKTYFVTSSNIVKIGTANTDNDSILSFLESLKELNVRNSFIPDEKRKEVLKGGNIGWWTTNISQPLGNWIRNNFGEDNSQEKTKQEKKGNIGVVAIKLSAKPAESENIILNTSLNSGDESISIIHGERLTFNQSNWDKPAYMVFQIDSQLTHASSAQFKGISGNIPFAWSITFLVMAGLFVVLAIYHKYILPKPDSDKAHLQTSAKSILREFRLTFVTFFKKPQALAAIFFMLTFRFSEAQLIKLINPFLLDPQDIGGLGLTTGQVGFVYGTIGIVGLVLGGITGGFAASRGGLRKWLWPMTLSMLLTSATFLYLAYFPTTDLLIINACVFIEQFGYGFGFTAYMLYLMYYSDGEHKTAHYAMCTGLMALGMMIPGMFSGWLQELLGYKHFFIWIMLCGIIPAIAVALLKIDSNYGKTKQ
ncbi:MFS transporter [Dysgonomonas sp. 216]|uniref:MFS transporter n=1 Tax=Dysgonomonas sp. 216 TaxID=2302934 RepID=UPI00351A87E9